MKDCSKYKIKAFVGFILFFIFYVSGKYLAIKYRPFSGEVEFFIAISAVSILIVTLKLALPYIKCIDENKKRFKKFK